MKELSQKEKDLLSLLKVYREEGLTYHQIEQKMKAFVPTDYIELKKLRKFECSPTKFDAATLSKYMCAMGYRTVAKGRRRRGVKVVKETSLVETKKDSKALIELIMELDLTKQKKLAIIGAIL